MEVIMSEGYDGVKRLAKEHPDWIAITEVCLELAKKDGEFSGKWVLNKCKEKGLTNWFPGLRRLVAYRILKHSETVRGGRRAYYTMPDQQGVEKALYDIEG